MNERIAENAKRFDSDETEFICECDDSQCTNRVEASLEEYEEVREDGATFMLAHGHGDETIERVVEKRDGFTIVEKVHHAARALARRLDPRAAEI